MSGEDLRSLFRSSKDQRRLYNCLECIEHDCNNRERRHSWNSERIFRSDRQLTKGGELLGSINQRANSIHFVFEEEEEEMRMNDQ